MSGNWGFPGRVEKREANSLREELRDDRNNWNARLKDGADTTGRGELMGFPLGGVPRCYIAIGAPCRREI
jgi:hypothetical protein